MADMALHLLQTTISTNPLQIDKLRNNLYAILTISDQFIPHKGLKEKAEELF